MVEMMETIQVLRMKSNKRIIEEYSQWNKGGIEKSNDSTRKLKAKGLTSRVDQAEDRISGTENKGSRSWIHREWKLNTQTHSHTEWWKGEME